MYYETDEAGNYLILWAEFGSLNNIVSMFEYTYNIVRNLRLHHHPQHILKRIKFVIKY